MRIHFLLFVCLAALAQTPAPKAAPRPAQIKGAACRSGAYKKSNDPALAMMCLAGALGTQGRGGLRVGISGFRKIACSRASGRAGWNCDYVATIETPGLATSPTMRELAQDQVLHARFVHTGNQWVRLQ